MKSKRSFILKAGLALVLCFILLVGTMTVGLAAIRDDLAATGLYTCSGHARIYFDTSAWTSFDTSHTVYFTMIFGSDSGQREILSMTRITNTRVYFLDLNSSDNNGYSGTYYNGLKGVMFFSSSNSGWASGYQNNKGYSDIVSYCGGYYTGTYDAHIYNNHCYYFQAASNTSGTAPTRVIDLYDVAYTIDSYTASTTYPTWRYTLAATVYTKETAAGGYDYVGNGNSARGGTVSVYGRTWDSKNSVTDSTIANMGGKTAKGDFMKYYNAAHSTTMRVVASAYPGYTFDGWYWNTTGAGDPVSTDLDFSYTGLITSDTNIYALFSKDSDEVDYYLTGYLEADGVTSTNMENKFTKVSTGKYQLTRYFTADASNYQYPKVSTNTFDVYHPVNVDISLNVSGTAADPDTDNYPYDNGETETPKWKVYAPANTIIRFTWDITNPSAPTLSWEQVKVKYQFAYTDRRGNPRTYTIVSAVLPTLAEYNAGGILTATAETRKAELTSSVINGLNDVLGKAFNKTYSITSEKLTSITDTPYVIKYNIDSCASVTPRTVTVYAYNNGTLTPQGDPYTTTGEAIDLPDTYAKNGPSAGAKFIGWYDYTGGTFSGDVISTHPNFGYTVARSMSIAPVFDVDEHYTGTNDTNGVWNSYIDYNQISMEMDSDSSGTIFNDNVIRFRYGGTDSAEQVNLSNSKAEVGIVIFAQKEGDIAEHGSTFDGYTAAQMQSVLERMKTNNLTAAKHSTSCTYMYYISTKSLSRLNRVNLVQMLDYDTFKNGKYKVMAYMYDGTNYVHSNAISGTYNNFTAQYTNTAA